MSSLCGRMPRWPAWCNLRAIQALAAAVVLGTIAFVAVREWRLARQALCSGTAASADEAASRLTLRAYRSSDALSPLVADPLVGRVGSQAAALQPVQGSIALEPTLSGAAAIVEPAFFGDGVSANDWLALARHPVRPSANVPLTAPSASLPLLPEPVSPADQGASVLLPADGNHEDSQPRSWDSVEIGPSLGPTAIGEHGPSRQEAGEAAPGVIGGTADIEVTDTKAADAKAADIEATDIEATDIAMDVETAADEPPPATPPKTISGADDMPKSEGVPKGKRSSLTEEVYASEIGRILKPIGQVTTRVASPPGEFHPDIPNKDERPRLPRGRELFAAEPAQVHGAGGIRTRPWPELIGLWEAPGTAHHPLYFEEVYLERYGYSFGLAQPVVSAAHFFGRIPALPYLMTVDPPHSCLYTLGHYRPGSCAPLAWDLVPFDPLAAAVQGGVVTGLVFLIP